MDNPNSLRERLDAMVREKLEQAGSLPLDRLDFATRMDAIGAVALNLLSQLDAAEAQVKALTVERDLLRVQKGILENGLSRIYQGDWNLQSVTSLARSTVIESNRAALKMEGE